MPSGSDRTCCSLTVHLRQKRPAVRSRSAHLRRGSHRGCRRRYRRIADRHRHGADGCLRLPRDVGTAAWLEPGQDARAHAHGPPSCVTRTLTSWVPPRQRSLRLTRPRRDDRAPAQLLPPRYDPWTRPTPSSGSPRTLVARAILSCASGLGPVGLGAVRASTGLTVRRWRRGVGAGG